MPLRIAEETAEEQLCKDGALYGPPIGEAELCAQARALLSTAYDQLQTVLSAIDHARFGTLSLGEVENAIKELERDLASRQALQNMGRLRGLFSKLAHYPEAFGDQYCKATYMPWLWAPILLTLRTTIAFPDILDKFLAAYKRIGGVLPYPRTLSLADKDIAERQQLLAVVYEDVLEVHQNVYTFLRQRGWESFFPVWWKQFGFRLEGIIHDIAWCNDQLERTVDIQTIELAKNRKIQRRKDLLNQEEEQKKTQLANVKSWLEAPKFDRQEDDVEELLERSHEGSCGWVYENPKVKSWLQRGYDHNLLWLKGKPGSGKSILCANIIQDNRSSAEVVMLYFLFTENTKTIRDSKSLLQALVNQLVLRNAELCAIIHHDFISGPSSVSQLRKLLPRLLATFACVRIIVDGIDDCDQKLQESILKELVSLSKCNGTKVLVSSQDIGAISKVLAARSSLDLSNEHIPTQQAISSIVRARIIDGQEIPAMKDSSEADQTMIENTLVNKADGMFLWVDFVFTVLKLADSFEEVQKALRDFPVGLDKVYEKLFERLRKHIIGSSGETVSRVFQCLACSERPLKAFEIQDAISFTQQNMVLSEYNRKCNAVFEWCKPFLERSKDGTVRLVHGSVKEYLVQHNPLFDMATAHANMAFSCLAYLATSVSLISDTYDQHLRLKEVAQGTHGFCRYACTYWVEHLLKFLKLATPGRQDSLKSCILTAAENVTQKLFEHSAGALERYNPPKKLIDERCDLLDKQRPLFKLVTSTLEMQLRDKIAPIMGKNPGDRLGLHPISRIRHEYDEISKRILQADTIEGIDAATLVRFKQIYGSSVYTCRVGRCPRGLHGFETAKERDAHEQGHLQDFRCSYPQCLYHRIGVGNAKCLKQHMEEYHPEKDPNQPDIKFLGDNRIDTQATLVEPGIAGADTATPVSSGFSSSEESEYADGTDFVKYVMNSDLFALGTTDW